MSPFRSITGRHSLSACLALGAALIGPHAGADTLYVDSSAGQPGALGTMQDPLATITEALSRFGGEGPHVVELAAGTYGSSTGEAFPWSPAFDLTLRGSADGESILDLEATGGASAHTAFVLDRYLTSTFASLEVHRLTVIGDRQDTFSEGRGAMTTYGSSFVGLASVVWGSNFADEGQPTNFVDTLFEDIGHVSRNGGGFPSSAEGTSSLRCIYRDCEVTNTAVHFYGPFASLIYYEDCLITGTGFADAPSTAYHACVADLIDGCTIVGNHVPGAAIEQDGFEIRNSIVAQNFGNDVWSPTDVRDSVVADGTGRHQGGVIVGDPRLVDLLGGDFRPAFNSPAVDALPADAARTDLRGQRRDVDGDLDLVPKGDMGAFELRPLDRPHDLSHRVPLGVPYDLEFRGAAHSFSQLLFTRTGLAPSTPTPYGGLVLLPDGVTRIAVVQLDGTGKATASVPLLGGPGLIGTTLGFQALGRSPVAPLGAAFSNGLELVVAAP